MTISERTRFECKFENECRSRKINKHKCETCENNTMRNYEVDFYSAANDNEIPEKCPELTYDGPAEQTAGYKCPVCEEYTNPYQLVNNRCKHCGYILNVK